MRKPFRVLFSSSHSPFTNANFRGRKPRTGISIPFLRLIVAVSKMHPTACILGVSMTRDLVQDDRSLMTRHFPFPPGVARTRTVSGDHPTGYLPGPSIEFLRCLQCPRRSLEVMAIHTPVTGGVSVSSCSSVCTGESVRLAAVITSINYLL